MAVPNGWFRRIGNFGGKADNVRYLTAKERALIRKVFTTAKLPPLEAISIGDGVNGRGGAWTDSDFEINVGPNYKDDLAEHDSTTLIHEMTHVWQYFHGTLTKAHAFGANVLYGFARRTDYLYDYNLGDSWDDFGFEGQAQLVEDWYDPSGDNMSYSSLRFVYVGHIIRKDSSGMWDLTLEEIQNWDAISERMERDQIDMTRPDPPRRNVPWVNPFEQLLEQRFPVGDPAALARVEKLKEYCQKTLQPKELLARLKVRRSDDRLARLFYEVLAPATTARLLKILEDRR